MPSFSVTPRSVPTSFEGGPYIIRRRTLFNRIEFFCVAVAGGATAKILVYQAPGGGAGIANLRATCAAIPLVAGTRIVATPAQGLVTLEEGLAYILIGRDPAAGTFTDRCWDVPFAELIGSTVDPDTHPLNFTTAILASTTPLTFNPRQSAGGSALATFTAVSPVVRFKRV